MADYTSIFGSFAVKDAAAARQFYGETLGLTLEPNEWGFNIQNGDSAGIFVYEKPDHEPAVFTVLNLEVADIDAVVDSLVQKGLTMERYESLPFGEQDDKGIVRTKEKGAGPEIAWCTDPSGNVIAIMGATDSD